MKDKPFLIVSGVVFALWALGQLYRVMMQVPVQFGTVNVPIWPSIFGTVLAVALCIWAFALAKRQP